MFIWQKQAFLTLFDLLLMELSKNTRAEVAVKKSVAHQTDTASKNIYKKTSSELRRKLDQTIFEPCPRSGNIFLTAKNIRYSSRLEWN